VGSLRRTLDPRQYTSGTSVHKKPRISKAEKENTSVIALFMPAWSPSSTTRTYGARTFYQHSAR